MSKNNAVVRALAAASVALGMLLGANAANAANAADVIFDAGTKKATGINNLNVNGKLYNLAFRTQRFAWELYGQFPGQFPFFNDQDTAADARNAILEALNQEDATGIVDPTNPDEGGVESQSFNVGYASDLIDPPVVDFDVPIVVTQRGLIEGTDWLSGGVNQWTWNFDERTYVEFTLASALPEVSIGGEVSGLEGSRPVADQLVLRNLGGDDLTIAADGVFTFDTKLTPGETYNVTVAREPTNPAQFCSMYANGSGTVPPEGVTNIAVVCKFPNATVGGTVTGLEGSGLVLQNNGTDDEEIDGDGSFTFDTPLAQGTSYEVKVLTQPTDPEQNCSVTNGNGTMASEAVTDVTVTCLDVGEVIVPTVVTPMLIFEEEQ